MPADLPDVLRPEARARSHRALLWGGLLGLLVVVAAGISGTIQFTGPRWVPNVSATLHPRSRPRPAPRGAPPRSPAQQRPGDFPTALVLWILVGIIVAVVAYLLWRRWAGRSARAATGQHSMTAAVPSPIPVEPEPEPDTPALRTGVELALQALDEEREPADAIVRAWLGLQETAQESGIVRGPAETPTEFTSRILSRAFADDRALRTLLRLYLRTRFGDHPATGEDVAAVRGALQELVRTWPADAVGPR